MQRFLRRIQYWLRARRLEAELAEELEIHRAMTQEKLERDGVPAGDAFYASRRSLGNVALARAIAARHGRLDTVITSAGTLAGRARGADVSPAALEEHFYVRAPRCCCCCCRPISLSRSGADRSPRSMWSARSCSSRRSAG